MQSIQEKSKVIDCLATVFLNDTCNGHSATYLSRGSKIRGNDHFRKNICAGATS